MRGADGCGERLFSTIRLAELVPEDHLLRTIRQWLNESLAKMDAKFMAMYQPRDRAGRPSIAPEKLDWAMLFQVLDSVRSDRQRGNDNLSFRWFIGLAIQDAVWSHSVFSKNRDAMLQQDLATGLLTATVEMARERGYLSGDHFSVDGTITQAWASHKSRWRKDGSDGIKPPENLHVRKRGNDTHESRSDPDARLYRKRDAAPAQLSYLGHVLSDNRHGLVVNVRASQSVGTTERAEAELMLADVANRGRRITIGADKGYDTNGVVAACRAMRVTPLVAQNTARAGGSANDPRMSRKPRHRFHPLGVRPARPD